MMRRCIRLLIAFDGTAYRGWQRQLHVPTIQATLEEALGLICGHAITLHGAGRTDSGVHALAMVAHFHTPVQHPLSAFIRGVNSLIPPDIRVLDAHEENIDFHCRYSALGKTYRYDLYAGQIQLPTRRLYEGHFPGILNIKIIETCLNGLIGTHDFSSFEAVGSRDPLQNGRGAVRTITHACLQENGRHRYSLFFTGDGFLRHMVRNLVGTLIQAGRGTISPEQFKKILASRDRSKAGPTAPARGLFLETIHYDQKRLSLTVNEQ
jgi:tRNA pseudouridine38-40 synthase